MQQNYTYEVVEVDEKGPVKESHVPSRVQSHVPFNIGEELSLPVGFVSEIGGGDVEKYGVVEVIGIRHYPEYLFSEWGSYSRRQKHRRFNSETRFLRPVILVRQKRENLISTFREHMVQGIASI